MRVDHSDPSIVSDAQELVVPRDLTLFEHENFERSLRDLVERSSRGIVLDCSELGQVTSRHIGLLWHAQQFCKEHDIAFRLANASMGLRRILTAMELNRFFDFEPHGTIASSALGSPDTQETTEVLVLNFDASYPSVEASRERFAGFLTGINVPELIVFELNTVFYEITRNIVEHAQLESGSQIRLSVSTGQNLIVLQFTDSGPEFDPTIGRKNEMLSTHSRLQIHRGLGLMMVRRLTDQIAYERRGGHNIFTIEKSWSDTP